jgi:hypothetical protein
MRVGSGLRCRADRHRRACGQRVGAAIPHAVELRLPQHDATRGTRPRKPPRPSASRRRIARPPTCAKSSDRERGDRCGRPAAAAQAASAGGRRHRSRMAVATRQGPGAPAHGARRPPSSRSLPDPQLHRSLTLDSLYAVRLRGRPAHSSHGSSRRLRDGTPIASDMRPFSRMRSRRPASNSTLRTRFESEQVNAAEMRIDRAGCPRGSRRVVG